MTVQHDLNGKIPLYLGDRTDSVNYVSFHQILQDFLSKKLFGSCALLLLTEFRPLIKQGTAEAHPSALQRLHYTHHSGEMGFVMMQPHNAAFALTSPGLSTEACQSISAWPCPSCLLSSQAQLGEHLQTQLIHCSREQLTHGQTEKCRLGDGQSGV